tara:strand:- start:1207 stop:1542 length:336 start_codon:yes stop_codon:yes gene_type:complete
MNLSINIPDEMAPYADDIEFFVTLMVRKLHTNRHKGTGKQLNLKSMAHFARGELAEVEQALAEQGQFEVAVECADVANFAFLMARSALNMTREEFVQSKSVKALPDVKGGK